MATKKSTAASTTDVSPDTVPVDDKLVYYNEQQTQHPRYHQPGDPEAAKADNEAAAARTGVSNDDIKPQPGFLPDPRSSEVVKTVGEVNEEIAKRPDTGDLGDTGK